MTNDSNQIGRCIERFIIASKIAGVYDGVYYSEDSAINSVEGMEAKWPGMGWAVQPTAQGFPVPGLVHLGEARAVKILKSTQQRMEVLEDSNPEAEEAEYCPGWGLGIVDNQLAATICASCKGVK